MLRRTSPIARLGALLMMMVSAAISTAAQTQPARLAADSIPVRAGLTVVQAVSGDKEQGDYEAIIRVLAATADTVRLESRAYVKLRTGRLGWLVINRTVRGADLREARLQILGFDSDDAEVIAGATALGPSVAVVRDLVATGQAEHIIRNYAVRRNNTGTLRRVERGTVPFPVLVNGQRVTVDAVHAVGSLGIPGSMRPFELYFLDHPVQPLTLKVSYGAENTSNPSPAEWTRQIVRIDFPDTTLTARMQKEMATNCRVNVPGVYFEFNSDLLNPASTPAVQAVAALLEENAGWTIEIEGHTDNIGGARYNLDLSNRRAASFRQALVSDHGIAAARLTTRGYGFERPVESNETVEGRARNRRVEIVRPCGG